MPQFPETFDPVRWWGVHAPERVALVDASDGRRWTYSELDRSADDWAHWLTQRGAGLDTRIAVLAPNCVEVITLFFGALRTGAALVPLNWRLSPAELDAVVADARPLLALHHAECTPPPAHGVDWQQLAAPTSHDTPFQAAPAEAERAALILYTSGSTGRPKGVVLPQRQLLFNAIATCTGWELGSSDIAPISTPLFHIGGWGVFALPLWHCGGAVVLMDRFDAEEFIRVMEEERCTVALTVPTQLVMLRAARGWGRPLTFLRTFFSGGAPCPATLAADVRAAGYRLREGYGLTECGPNCFAISDDEALHRPGSVGRPMPFLQMRISDEAGRDVADGDAGELWLRGPQVCAGYFDDPVRTAEALTPDGWLRTGDLARRDADGLYAICGRRKEMFISGGENVFPGEVEAVLMSCPGVAEAAVLGVPDAHWGEVGHAFVVRSDPALDDAGITAFARLRLAGYKVPRRMTLVTDLPRLASGKVDRRALTEYTAMEEA
jgi:fatty-acyl-CoA synthase